MKQPNHEVYNTKEYISKLEIENGNLKEQLKIAKSYLYLIANQIYVGEKDNCINDAKHALDVIKKYEIS